MRGWGGPALGAGDSYRLPMASSSWSATSAPLNATLDSGHRWVARGARARWDHLRLRWVVRSHPIAVCSSRQGVLDHAAAAHLRPVAAVAASQSANLHARGASRSGHPFGALEQWAPQSRVLLPCCVSPSVGAAPGRGLRFTAMVARWCSQFQPCRLLRDWSRPSLPNVEKLRSEQDPLFINPASVDSFARSTLPPRRGSWPWLPGGGLILGGFQVALDMAFRALSKYDFCFVGMGFPEVGSLGMEANGVGSK